MAYLNQIGSIKVETWYDRKSRNWISQIKDDSGNQVGQAHFAGNRGDAKSNHQSIVKEVLDESRLTSRQ